MKNLFIGLLIGMVLSVIAGIFLLPDMKQTAYNSGFDAGNKKGISTGTTTGITEGIAQLKAEQKRQHDSLVTAQENAAAQWKATHRATKAPPPPQNWHVIDGKIDEPVIDTTGTAAAHAKKGHK